MLFVQLTTTFHVTGYASAEDLDAHLDTLMTAMLNQEGADLRDSDVSAVLAEGLVTISVAAAGLDFDDAAARADSCIRSAIHAAGGSTPTWQRIESNSRALTAA